MTQHTKTPRYIVMPKSKSAHCCFEATITDTTRPEKYSDEYETVCECFDIKSAELVANILNSHEALVAAVKSCKVWPGGEQQYDENLIEKALNLAGEA